MTRAKVLLTCDQHTGMPYGVCHEFSGPDAAGDVTNACNVGTRGTGCPASAIGRCDLNGVGTNPAGYVQWHYVTAVFTDASVSEKLCKDSGGTWSAP